MWRQRATLPLPESAASPTPQLWRTAIYRFMIGDWPGMSIVVDRGRVPHGRPHLATAASRPLREVPQVAVEGKKINLFVSATSHDISPNARPWKSTDSETSRAHANRFMGVDASIDISYMPPDAFFASTETTTVNPVRFTSQTTLQTEQFASDELVCGSWHREAPINSKC